MKQIKQSFITCKQLSIGVPPTSHLLSTTIYYLDYLYGPVFGNLGDRSRIEVSPRVVRDSAKRARPCDGVCNRATKW